MYYTNQRQTKTKCNQSKIMRTIIGIAELPLDLTFETKGS